MNSAIFKIGIAIAFITIYIYIIKNFKKILNVIEKYKEKKIIKYIMNAIIILLLIVFLKYMYNQILVMKDYVAWYQTSKKNDVMFAEYDKKIVEENKFYNEMINRTYESQKYSEPYIPEGFSYVEGTWESGFVIQDTNQNQYVWVPCTNTADACVEKLQRSNFSNQAFLSKDLCTNNYYEKFLESALENGGFYISRFEIGKENNKPVSKKNVEIWKDVTREEAEKIIESMYDNINCELINGYAYDTTLLWLMNTNEIKENIIKIKDQKEFLTGKTCYNNIYDFTDNTMELTSETYYSNVIIRGFPYEIAQDSKEISLRNFGYNIENFDRFSIADTENYFTITTILGFRTVIYK